MSPAQAMQPCLAGVGLKTKHVRELLAPGRGAFVDGAGFFEVHAENYMLAGGPMLRHLEQVRERWPLSIHGVGLSIGGDDTPDAEHLERLSQLLRRFEPRWFSEHLAWSSHGGRWFNDLLPLPYDRTTLARVCDHIDRVQERLQRRMLLENPSTYLEYAGSTLDEAQFLTEVVRRTGCGLLLDVNNAYVSGVNHGRDPWCLIEGLPAHAIDEIHLAGFAEDRDGADDRLLIDHHGAAVDDAVWSLYERTIVRLGPVATLIERDNDVPPLHKLEAEARRAIDIQRTAPGRARPSAREDGPTPACQAAGSRVAMMPPGVTAAAPAAPSPAAFAAAVLDAALPPPAGLTTWNGSDPGARLAVYRNNVIHSLTQVLGDTFPVLRSWVGAEFFDAMAGVYVRQAPPVSPLMTRYGEGFVDWVAGFEPAAGLPHLQDLARLEYARLAASHAAHAPPLEPDVLARALEDPDRLAETCFALHPSVVVIRSTHAVVSLWRAHQQNDAVRDELLAGLDLARAEAALVFRSDDDAIVLEVPDADAGLAAAWCRGEPLAIAQVSNPEAGLVRVLALLLQHRLIVGLEMPARAPCDHLETET